MTTREPMICPKCGVPMNFHAEKPLRSMESDEEDTTIEIHTCPKCGSTATR